MPNYIIFYSVLFTFSERFFPIELLKGCDTWTVGPCVTTLLYLLHILYVFFYIKCENYKNFK